MTKLHRAESCSLFSGGVGSDCVLGPGGGVIDLSPDILADKINQSFPFRYF